MALTVVFVFVVFQISNEVSAVVPSFWGCTSDEMCPGKTFDSCTLCPNPCAAVCGLDDPLDPICRPRCQLLPVCECLPGFVRDKNLICIPEFWCHLQEENLYPRINKWSMAAW